MHIYDQLKIIRDNLDGISQDIKDLLAVSPGENVMQIKAIEQAKEDAYRTNKRVYLYGSDGQWHTTYVSPSKYHEGKVTAIDPNGEVTVYTYDGDRGDD